jgi:hypothetical protein
MLLKISGMCLVVLGVLFVLASNTVGAKNDQDRIRLI